MRLTQYEVIMTNNTFYQHLWYCPNGHEPLKTIINYPEYDPSRCLSCDSKMYQESRGVHD